MGDVIDFDAATNKINSNRYCEIIHRRATKRMQEETIKHDAWLNMMTERTEKTKKLFFKIDIAILVISCVVFVGILIFSALHG